MPGPPQTSIEAILDGVDHALDAPQPDFISARSSCLTILKLRNPPPSDELLFRALSHLGAIESELGNFDRAKQYFHDSLKLAPQNDQHAQIPSVHFYLAQSPLSTPHQSLEHYHLGLNILKSKLNSIKPTTSPSTLADENISSHLKSTPTRAGQESEIKRNCSRALVGMTEIYLTDLCFEPDAQEKCLEYLNLAIELDPDNPEPLQALASVKLSQSDPLEAQKILSKARSLWHRNPESGSPPLVSAIEHGGLVNEDCDVRMDESGSLERDLIKQPTDQVGQNCTETLGNSQNVRPPRDLPLPDLEIRKQWSRLAMECEMYDEAIQVLQDCESENDQEGEVQYLLGLAWFFLGQGGRNDLGPEIKDAPLKVQPKSLAGMGKIHSFERSECWLEARECLDSCVQLNDQLDPSQTNLDPSIIRHVKKLMSEIDGGLNFKDREHDEEAEEGVDDEIGWEDDSDSQITIDES